MKEDSLAPLFSELNEDTNESEEEMVIASTVCLNPEEQLQVKSKVKNEQSECESKPEMHIEMV